MEVKFTIINEWQGGIPSGSFCLMNGAYVVRFVDGTRKSFNIKLKNAKKSAEKYRKEQSLKKNLTRNMYRIIHCDIEGEYIEIQLQKNYIAKIDVDDLQLALKYKCYAHKGHDRLYMYQTVDRNKKLLFHRVLFPEYKQVDHINRDGLDNRRKNLRPVSVTENNLNQKKRKDNKSGKTGIHYSKYDKCWVVQWPENGKRRKKSFSESKYGYEGAKLMAINYRQQMDNKNSLMNGYESDSHTNINIEPIDISNVKSKEKHLSTNKSGKKGVYFVEKYNFWAVEWRENGKKRCKRFYVGTKRNYDEAKNLAMSFQG